MPSPIVNLLILAALMIVNRTAQAAPADSIWTRDLGAARAAMARNDDRAAVGPLERLDQHAHGHSGAMYALASIAARSGDRATALRWLREFAATGLTRSVARDTNFRSLVDDPEFRVVAARIDSNGAGREAARLAHRFEDTDMLAEDLAWDAKRRRFLVSSIHRHKIVAVDPSGRERDFFAGADLWGVYALAIDPKRDRLWATMAAGPVTEGYVAADSGRTALLAFDLETGREQARIELPQDGARHVLGDMSLGSDGTVYMTESVGGGVYRLRPGATKLETLAPSGTFGSPQMSSPSADGRRLLLADYPRGLAWLDLRSGAVEWLAKPRTLASGGIDGFARDGRRVIVVQNGTSPHRVVELTLDPRERAILDWRVLEQASDWLGEPNHGVLVGREFYFLGNSGWDRVNDKEELTSSPTARPPVILGLSLDAPHAPR